jgi:hypothetical protein
MRGAVPPLRRRTYGAVYNHSNNVNLPEYAACRLRRDYKIRMLS